MASTDMKNVLVTGAIGQIGSELTAALRERHGRDHVLATDVRELRREDRSAWEPYQVLDVTDADAIASAVDAHHVDTIYHLAAILSATGEARPDLCWRVNMGGLKNVLDVGVERGLNRIFVPSSIAVFGTGCRADDTPNDVPLQPRTVYGITKVAGELLAEYYVGRHGLDCRGVRYPGVISHLTRPGGGTTDYAVGIYYDAVRHGRYTCFVGPDTVLPMIYMPDAIKATLDLMDAPFDRLRRHADYNIAGMSFSAAELADSIRARMPDFECIYEPDHRQAIADSWPRSIDDAQARADWGWGPDYDLPSMTDDMLTNLRGRHEQGRL